MPKPRKPAPDFVQEREKAAARYMLKHGLGTVAEIAELCGRSRQIVHYWAADFPDARNERLVRNWQRALLRA